MNSYLITVLSCFVTGVFLIILENSQNVIIYKRGFRELLLGLGIVACGVRVCWTNCILGWIVGVSILLFGVVTLFVGIVMMLKKERIINKISDPILRMYNDE